MAQLSSLKPEIQEDGRALCYQLRVQRGGVTLPSKGRRVNVQCEDTWKAATVLAEELEPEPYLYVYL